MFVNFMDGVFKIDVYALLLLCMMSNKVHRCLFVRVISLVADGELLFSSISTATDSPRSCYNSATVAKQSGLF